MCPALVEVAARWNEMERLGVKMGVMERGERCQCQGWPGRARGAEHLTLGLLGFYAFTVILKRGIPVPEQGLHLNSTH